MKKFNQSNENNKTYILSVIEKYVSGRVLEIASGTGQHAVYFTSILTDIIWQTSELDITNNSLQQWIEESNNLNLLSPINIDLNSEWDVDKYDHIYTSNSFHIVSMDLVNNFFKESRSHINEGGTVIVYGPFKENDNFISNNDEQFNKWIKNNHPNGGLKNIEDILSIASEHNFKLSNSHDLPKSNRVLIFK